MQRMIRSPQPLPAGLFDAATVDIGAAEASANDLAIALQTLEIEIEYLDSRLADTGPAALAAALQASFTARRNSLRRACRFFAAAAEADKPTHANLDTGRTHA